MANELWQWVVGGIGALTVAILGWAGKRQIDRIDQIEKRKANKDSTDARFAEMLSSLNRHIDEDRGTHQLFREAQERTQQEQSKTNVILAEMVGELRALRKQGE